MDTPPLHSTRSTFDLGTHAKHRHAHERFRGAGNIALGLIAASGHGLSNAVLRGDAALSTPKPGRAYTRPANRPEARP